MGKDSELATYCFRSRTGRPNFGDELGPEVLERLGYRTRRVPLPDAEIISAGSILGDALRRGRDGLLVWGSGLIRPTEVPPHRLRICAVRGRLTASALHVDVPLGDPGILVPRLWRRPRVRFRLGVVPHYVDKRSFAWADRVIDVSRPVTEVIESIGSCSTIVTSSLHGLIIAQAWGIPTMRLPHDGVVGGDWKWVDFVSALDGSAGKAQDALCKALKDGLRGRKGTVAPAIAGPGGADPMAPRFKLFLYGPDAPERFSDAAPAPR